MQGRFSYNSAFVLCCKLRIHRSARKMKLSQINNTYLHFVDNLNPNSYNKKDKYEK